MSISAGHAIQLAKDFSKLCLNINQLLTQISNKFKTRNGNRNKPKVGKPKTKSKNDIGPITTQQRQDIEEILPRLLELFGDVYRNPSPKRSFEILILIKAETTSLKVVLQSIKDKIPMPSLLYLEDILRRLKVYAATTRICPTPTFESLHNPTQFFIDSSKYSLSFQRSPSPYFRGTLYHQDTDSTFSVDLFPIQSTTSENDNEFIQNLQISRLTILHSKISPFLGVWRHWTIGDGDEDEDTGMIVIENPRTDYYAIYHRPDTVETAWRIYNNNTRATQEMLYEFIEFLIPLHHRNSIHGCISPTMIRGRYPPKFIGLSLQRVRIHHFSSPEHYNEVSQHEVSYSSDLWSFGCLAYFAFTGITPFEGANVSQVTQQMKSKISPASPSPNIPSWLSRILEICWDYDITARSSFIPIAVQLSHLLFPLSDIASMPRLPSRQSSSSSILSSQDSVEFRASPSALAHTSDLSDSSIVRDRVQSSGSDISSWSREDILDIMRATSPTNPALQHLQNSNSIMVNLCDDRISFSSFESEVTQRSQSLPEFSPPRSLSLPNTHNGAVHTPPTNQYNSVSSVSSLNSSLPGSLPGSFTFSNSGSESAPNSRTTTPHYSTPAEMIHFVEPFPLSRSSSFNESPRPSTSTSPHIPPLRKSSSFSEPHKTTGEPFPLSRISGISETPSTPPLRKSNSISETHKTYSTVPFPLLRDVWTLFRQNKYNDAYQLLISQHSSDSDSDQLKSYSKKLFYFPLYLLHCMGLDNTFPHEKALKFLQDGKQLGCYLCSLELDRISDTLQTGTGAENKFKLSRDTLEPIYRTLTPSFQQNPFAQFFCSYYVNTELKIDNKNFVSYLINLEQEGAQFSFVPMGLCYLNAWGVPKSSIEAFKCFKHAAHVKISRGQEELGKCYLNGIGTPQPSISDANHWFKKAAFQGCTFSRNILIKHLISKDFFPKSLDEKRTILELAANDNNSTAQQKLGEIYYYGLDGEEQSYERAFKWFQKASHIQNGEAELFLGKMYFYGYFVSQSYRDALIWFQKATDKGIPEAEYLLGYLYLTRGSPLDGKTAIYWIQKSADAGWPAAELLMARELINEPNKNALEARRWFMKASEHVNNREDLDTATQAMVELGLIYMKGIDIPEDLNEAFRYFADAKKYNTIHSVAAQYYLGILYCRCVGASPPQCFDNAKACFNNVVNHPTVTPHFQPFIYLSYFQLGLLHWNNNKLVAYNNFQEAAKGDLADAQYYIGIYHLGFKELAERRKSFAWFTKAANNPNPGNFYIHAMTELAKCHESGIGTKKDLPKAKIWRDRIAQYTTQSTLVVPFDDLSEST